MKSPGWIGSTTIELLFNERLTGQTDWNTADIFAGSYRLRATLEDSARTWQQTASADFAIAEVIELQSRISTGQISYAPGETVTMNATVDYTDGNVIIADATGRFTIYDENDHKVTELTSPLNGLLPGTRRELVHNWNAVTAAPGRYRLHFAVEYKDRILAESETLFERLDQLIQFSGTLSPVRSGTRSG